MENQPFVYIIIIILALILLGVAMVKKAEWLLNFVMRGILGTIGIFSVNSILSAQNIPCEVGINFVTVLANATLGFPGFLLLYGIRLMEFL